MGSILSSILAAIVGAITSAIRQKRLDKERIADAKKAAVLEVQNDNIKNAKEATERAASVRGPDYGKLLDRLRSGKI
jgi:uncharacterized membrane protein (DUF106 family)